VFASPQFFTALYPVTSLGFILLTRCIYIAFVIWREGVYITKLCRQQAEVIQNHDNENVRNIGQGEARHRKYKKLKLGGGHVYDRSESAVVALATTCRA
jgi:hypothetical protein